MASSLRSEERKQAKYWIASILFFIEQDLTSITKSQLAAVIFFVVIIFNAAAEFNSVLLTKFYTCPSYVIGLVSIHVEMM